MSVTLFQRVAAAFLTGNAAAGEREPLIQAVQTAEEFTDLDPQMQHLLTVLESRTEQEAPDE